MFPTENKTNIPPNFKNKIKSAVSGNLEMIWKVHQHYLMIHNFYFCIPAAPGSYYAICVAGASDGSSSGGFGISQLRHWCEPRFSPRLLLRHQR